MPVTPETPPEPAGGDDGDDGDDDTPDEPSGEPGDGCTPIAELTGDGSFAARVAAGIFEELPTVSGLRFGVLLCSIK